MKRLNRPNVAIRVICCYLASAFFEDKSFTAADLIRLMLRYNLWLDAAPLNSNANDVFIVSSAPCNANVRTYLAEEATMPRGMLSRKGNDFRCNMEAIERMKHRHSFPDQEKWRTHVGVTTQEEQQGQQQQEIKNNHQEHEELMIRGNLFHLSFPLLSKVVTD